MARAINIPKNVDVNEFTSILVLAKTSITDPAAPSAATLQAAPELAFEHTTAGPTATTTQAVITDPRFSLKAVPEAPGEVTHTLEPTYFWGDPDLDMDPLIVEGAELWYVIRDVVAVTEDYAAGQKVDLYSVKAGIPRKNREHGGKATKTTKLFVQQAYFGVTLVA